MAAPVCPWIEWTDALGAATLRCLGYTFDSWAPDVNDVGDSQVPIGDSRTYFFAYRQDQIASFGISQIANTQTDLALRLKSHLVRGGSIIIHTEDSESRVYNSRIAPGTIPTFEPSDQTELEYTLKMVVVNNSLPVPMLYTPFPSPRTLDNPTTDVPVIAPFTVATFFTDSYIQLPNSSVMAAVPNDWTVEGWIREGDYPGFLTLLGFGTNGGEFKIGHMKDISGEAGRMRVSQSASGGDVFLSTAHMVPIEMWTHFAISRRSIDGKFSSYINGSPDRTNVAPLAAQTSAIAGTSRRLAGTTVPGQQQQGWFSDLRVWNVVRTPAQIAANYNRRLAAQAGLIGYWRADEGSVSSLVLPDSSGFGADGAMHSLGDDHSNFVTDAGGPTFLP